MIGKPLTEEESAFIRDYTYPLFALREAFKERFGWLPCDLTLSTHRTHRTISAHGTSRYAPGDAILFKGAVAEARNRWIENQTKRDEFFKEHS